MSARRSVNMMLGAFMAYGSVSLWHWEDFPFHESVAASFAFISVTCLVDYIFGAWEDSKRGK